MWNRLARLTEFLPRIRLKPAQIQLLKALDNEWNDICNAKFKVWISESSYPPRGEKSCLVYENTMLIPAGISKTGNGLKLTWQKLRGIISYAIAINFAIK